MDSNVQRFTSKKGVLSGRATPLQGATNAVQSAVSSARKTITSGNNWTIAFIMLLMIVIVGITIFIVAIIKRNNTKDTTLMDKTYVALDEKSDLPYVVSSNNIENISAGKGYTLNFWLYLSDNYDETTEHKLVMYRGQRDNDIGPLLIRKDANPIIAMHKKTNKMMIAVSTKQVPGTMSLDQIFEQEPNSYRYKSNYLVTSVDYVPLQRWVNFTIMVHENTLRVYMDGDIYSVVTTSDMAIDNKVPMVRYNNDDFVMGDSATPIRGYLANMRFMNDVITQKKIRDIYNSGPVAKSILSYLGLNKYGLQSPVYRID